MCVYLYVYTLYKDSGRYKHVTMLYTRLCGHNYEYRTTPRRSVNTNQLKWRKIKVQCLSNQNNLWTLWPKVAYLKCKRRNTRCGTSLLRGLHLTVNFNGRSPLLWLLSDKLSYQPWGRLGEWKHDPGLNLTDIHADISGTTDGADKPDQCSHWSG